MTHRRCLVAALTLPLVAVALAGCASGPAASADPTTVAAKPTTTTVDIRPWASVVSRAEATYQKWRTSWDKNGCTSIDADPANGGSFACGISVLSGAFTATTVALEIDGAVSKSSKVYIGSPPEPIMSLYRDTKTAADEASAAGDAYQAACVGKSGAECVGLAQDLLTALDQVDSQFAAWQPYL